MSTVAQHYQPERPIVVGNHQPRCSSQRASTQHRASFRISTFPSLVGSFESRLEVGSRQLRVEPLRDASHRRATHLNVYQTQQRPHSCGHWWACPAFRPAPHPYARQRYVSQCNSTNYATQRRRPFGRVRWVSSCCRVSQRTISHHVAPPHISTNTCQASVAFRQLAVRRNRRRPDPLRATAQHAMSHLVVPHLNAPSTTT